MDCCRDGCPSGMFSHYHRGTLELCLSDHWVLGRLPDQGPSLQITQFGRADSARKSLGCSKLPPFKNDGGHCVLGKLQSCRNILEPFPRPVSQHNTVSDLSGQLLRHHGLVFALTCTVNFGIIYRQVCAFPNHVQSFEFTTGGLQSSFRNMSRMINGNRMHLSSNSSLIANGLNNYVNNVFLFLFLF